MLVLLSCSHVPVYSDIMRDNMILNLTGKNLPVDLNMEHLVRIGKSMLPNHGSPNYWEILGDASAAIPSLQKARDAYVHGLKGNYMGTSHTTPDTSAAVWSVMDAAHTHKLQTTNPLRKAVKPTVDTILTGRNKLQSSSVDTFNKKIQAMGLGVDVGVETDELEPLAIDVSNLGDN
ncbi:hypothetical protein PUNSTDRAFT_64360 [Punctularia strigosozonata HHB-11173 SS5]|uniref:uncharacterized protein n=1 Tax=Punctularia strigosozonata (strain HHB-11173) TaxID=741275 RepID=UPI0004417EC6|nr:uncharacterized protein PUNSTDRAFT_64360 [Punctularia strigosozonata HHB-11173 SS5]EIN10215.1 hypothetical protein PUNSTDRAFT_64360 [Punctularia strigosozonata HHB-11173 SS5]